MQIKATRSMFLRTMGIVFVAVFLAGCTPNAAQKDRTSPLLSVTDAKTLVLQLGDLPGGSSEGTGFEVTPTNLDQTHLQGKIDDISYAALKDTGFKTMAVQTYTLDGDAQVTSVVIVFADVASARKYLVADVRGKALSGSSKLGDESYSEQVTTEHQEGGERVITGDSIHSVIRVQNAIAECTLSDQPSLLDKDEALDLARRAAAKLR